MQRYFLVRLAVLSDRCREKMFTAFLHRSALLTKAAGIAWRIPMVTGFVCICVLLIWQSRMIEPMTLSVLCKLVVAADHTKCPRCTFTPTESVTAISKSFILQITCADRPLACANVVNVPRASCVKVVFSFAVQLGHDSV